MVDAHREPGPAGVVEGLGQDLARGSAFTGFPLEVGQPLQEIVVERALEPRAAPFSRGLHLVGESPEAQPADDAVDHRVVEALEDASRTRPGEWRFGMEVVQIQSRLTA